MAFSILISSGYATEFVLLHTNDMHGFVEHTVTDEYRGGYAAMAHLMNERRALAHGQGLGTLTLDAGDFLEGSMFYVVDKAERVLEIMNLLKYDSVALGNHDWLMGTQGLSDLLKNTTTSFDILAANIEVDRKRFPGLQKLLPYKIYSFEGKRVAVMGLTTDEYYYAWAFDKGKIRNPIKTAKQTIKKIKSLGVKTIIALTHLGLMKELDLIKQTEGIDLVVGGHSHSLLMSTVYANNAVGKKVPLLQVGEHAQFLGELRLKIKDDGGLKVLEHQVISVPFEKKDPKVVKEVEKIRHGLNKVYGRSNLAKVVGRSDVDLINSNSQMTSWSLFITQSFREALNTDIGIHAPNLAGVDLPAGEITREQIMQGYPRFFSLNDRWGWRLYRVKLMGAVVKTMLDYFLTGPEAMALSGVTFKIKNHKGKKKIVDLKINGEKVKFFKIYTLALPEGVIRGGIGVSPLLLEIFKSVERTEVNLWSALEEKFDRDGTIKGQQFGKELLDNLNNISRAEQLNVSNSILKMIDTGHEPLVAVSKEKVRGHEKVLYEKQSGDSKWVEFSANDTDTWSFFSKDQGH